MKPVTCPVSSCTDGPFKTVKSMASHWNHKKRGHVEQYGPLTSDQRAAAKHQEDRAKEGATAPVATVFAPRCSSSTTDTNGKEEAVPVRVFSSSSSSSSSVTPNSNPAAALVSIPEEYFTSCRVTPDRELSVYDAIAKFLGVELNYARPVLAKFRSSNPGLLLRNYKFPGERQRETPVAPVHVIHRILCLLPGRRSDALRAAASETHTRAVAGDLDLELAIRQRRAQISPEFEQLLMQGIQRSKDANADMQRRIEAQAEAIEAQAESIEAQADDNARLRIQVHN